MTEQQGGLLDHVPTFCWQEEAVMVPSGGRALDSEVHLISKAKMSRFCSRHTNG